MGLQLFSVNDVMSEDPVGTLRQLREMGYQDLETYGFDAEQGTFYGYPAAGFKTILDDNLLTASSGHFGFSAYLDRPSDAMKTFVDQCISGARALNMSYITWPWLAPEQRNLEQFKRLTGVLNSIGEQVNAAGLQFAYHNHGFEFEETGGEIPFDVIVRDTDPDLVKLELDFYWLIHSSSLLPREVITRHAGRIPLWHIKDMDKVTRDYTELGNGSIDYTTLLPNPSDSGLEFCYVEQGGNFTRSSLESAGTNAEYYRKHLSRRL